MDNRNATRKELEEALSLIMDNGAKILKSHDDEIKIGWTELSVGDYVYFKTFDDHTDSVIIAKGEIIEVITSEKKIMNRPDDNMKSNGWHRETNVCYKVRWNGLTTNIDSRYVYIDEMDATIAALYNTIRNYPFYYCKK